MVATIVGVFRDRRDADEARQELLDAGFPDRDILLTEQQTSGPDGEALYGLWEGVRDWFEEDAAFSEEAETRRSEIVLTVVTDAARLDEATRVLERHHPLDIESA